MQYQKMPPREGQFETGDLRQAKKCTAKDVRFVLQKRKLTSLPKGIENIKHLQRVELDLSYNRTLPHDLVFQGLVDYPNVKGLGLIKHEMGELPDSIGLLHQLEVLDLWSNELKELPLSFANLVNLEYLNFRNNKLKEIPDYFRNFKKLKEINLRFNKVKKLPEPLLALTELEHLDLTSTGLNELPDEISVFKNLRVLVLEKNKLKKLPESLSQLKNLERVELKGNKNLDWNQVFGILKHLPKIKTLSFSGWDLTELPEAIGQLQQLENLDLGHNKLKRLPASIASLTNLKELIIGNNPWETKELLPVLSQVKAFKRLQNNYILGEFPEGDFQFPYLEEVSLSNYPGRQLPDWFGKMKNVKSIFLYGSNLESLPDMSGLASLETLGLSNNESLKINPNQLIQIPNLQSLSINNNKNTLNLAELKGIKNLKKLSLPNMEASTFELCKAFPNLEEVYLPRPDNRPPTNLPDSFFNLTQLKTVNLYGILEENLIPILEKLKSFKRLETLSIPYHLDTKVLVDAIKEHQNLKQLLAGLKYPFTEELGELSCLKNLEVFNFTVHGIGWRAKDTFTLPNSYINFPRGILKHRNYQPQIDAHDAFIEKIKSWQLNDEEKERIFFLLWKKDFKGIEAFVKSPFDEQGKLEGEVIFIAGRPSHGTLKELETKLKDRGAKVSKKWKDDVTYVLLTPNIKEKNWEVLIGKSGFEFMLEDQLKDQAIAEDTPYLMEEGNEGLTEQITNLLKAKEDDQISLILELIEGGGANKTLLSYLGAIHLFHFDNEVRKKSRKLFRKFASSMLQEHIKKTWKPSFKDREFSYWNIVLENEEIDVASFIHAYKMVKWHEMKSGKGKQNYRNSPQFHGRMILNLNDKLPLSDAVKDWEWLRHLNIASSHPIDLNWLYEMLKDTGVEHIQLRLEVEDFPNQLISIPTLGSFHLSKYNHHNSSNSKPIVINEPVEGNISSLVLGQLTLENTHYLSNLTGLENLSINGCQFGEIDFISNFKNLKQLSLVNCNLNVIPTSFEKLSQLENLNLSTNKLEKLELNFSALQNLKDFSVANNSLRTMSDTFEGCQSLSMVNFENNLLSELPSSLFTINSKHTYPQLRILAQKNQITSIAVFKNSIPLRERPYIREVKLDENQLTEIPSLFVEKNIVQDIHIANNPITELSEAIQNTELNLISFSTEKMKIIPSFIFKGKTNYWIDIKNQDIQLPSQEEILQHNKYFRIFMHHRAWADAENDIKRINDFIQYVEKQRVQ